MRTDWTECQIPPPSWNENAYDCDDCETVLTSVVRRCYLNHLKNTLEQNYALYSAVESECNDIVERYALKLERKALRECMVASLYQKSMLTMINEVKQCTAEHKLYAYHHQELEAASPQVLARSCSGPNVGPFLTPPADYPAAIKPNCNDEDTAPCIQSMLNLDGEKIISEDCNIDIKSDEVTQNVLGGDEHFNASLRSDSSYDWNQIEKEMARVCGQMFSGSDSDLKKMLMEDDCIPTLNPVDNVVKDTPSTIHPCREGYDWQALRVKHEGELKRRWETLEKSASLEKQAKVKRRILQLFGEDELALAEASCDMTEKEAAQYRERVAPWIVKHLMPFYKEKRIASRILFKKLARHITDCLIFRNRLPDECDIWMAVQEFFQDGKGISSEADLFL